MRVVIIVSLIAAASAFSPHLQLGCTNQRRLPSTSSLWQLKASASAPQRNPSALCNSAHSLRQQAPGTRCVMGTVLSTSAAIGTRMLRIFVAMILFLSGPSIRTASASIHAGGPQVVMTAQASAADPAEGWHKMTMKELKEYKADHGSQEQEDFIRRIDKKGHMGERVVDFLLKIALPVLLFWMFVYLFLNNQ